jgi:DNA-binding response OmpR family regulator
MDAMVVEDDEATRVVLSSVLAARGHHVTTFAAGEEALLACRRRLPRLMLVDWLLPRRDGLELCREVRRMVGGYGVAILVVTVRDEPGDLEAVLAAGADDYLAKPFALGTLTVRLAVAERHAAVLAQRDEAEAAAREQIRLQGALLAAATVQHHLGNQLSITMGYAEMLKQAPGLDLRLRGLAQEAFDGVVAARETLHRLAGITRLELDGELGGPPVLDLARSAPDWGQR